MEIERLARLIYTEFCRAYYAMYKKNRIIEERKIQAILRSFNEYLKKRSRPLDANDFRIFDINVLNSHIKPIINKNDWYTTGHMLQSAILYILGKETFTGTFINDIS